MKHKFWLLGLLPILACAACVGEPNELAPAGAGAAGAGRTGDSWKGQPAPWDAKPAPSPATVTPPPPQLNAQTGGEVETHGVVNYSDCQKMAEKFRRQGRRVTLTKTERSSNPGAVLEYTCYFEGEDAQQGYFDDGRY